jgi:hypothetical protein
VNVKQWAKSMREHVRRERIDYLVKWAKENKVEDLQLIYEKARSEFPMASKENVNSYAKAALKVLKLDDFPNQRF